MLIFHEVLYRPLLNALIAFYSFLPGSDLGVAIIALTILVRLILIPLVVRQYRSQRKMAELQPKIQEIRKKHTDQKEQSQKILALYRDAGVHPASGCLPLLIQLPVLFALYRALIDGLNGAALGALYPWMPHPEAVNHIAFGFLDLSVPNVPLAVATGVLQFFQSRLLIPKKRPSKGEMDMTAAMNTQMLYIMPVVTAIFALRLPAGLPLYWAAATLLGILQQILLQKRYGPIHTPIIS